ncbi:MAG: flagellar export chaperone FliS [Spirochaetia bacterium]
MSTRANPVSAYKETSVRTASGGKIVVMLYDEAIKQLDLAVALLETDTKELDRVSNAILKAQDIITELMVSLDFEKGGEIAPKLFGLYRFFNDQLMEANIRKEASPLRSVRLFLGELREAWAQILGKTQVQGGATTGVNIAG